MVYQDQGPKAGAGAREQTETTTVVRPGRSDALPSLGDAAMGRSSADRDRFVADRVVNRACGLETGPELDKRELPNRNPATSELLGRTAAAANILVADVPLERLRG
jgi:hypothetical protein